MQGLRIVKRNGEKTPFNPQKIQMRIKKAAKGLKVNPDQIFINVMNTIPYEGDLETTKLDKQIADVAAAYTGSHYDNSRFAANISISSYHKETLSSFTETMRALNDDGVVHADLIAKIDDYGVTKVDDIIDNERDYNFDYFAWRTLQEMYLLKNGRGVPFERPQHMYLRVALWVTNSLKEAKEYYESLSKQLISPATPIMINAGTTVPQLASCVLEYNSADSIDGLINTFSDVSRYSAAGAGIGLCMSNIRSKDTRIKSSGGKAMGLLKYLKIINEGLRGFNQQGRRPGAAAIYLEPWHRDIFDLLDIKRNTGLEEARARDLFTALWVPDLFFKAVREDLDWHLFCPHDIKKAGLKPLQDVYGEEFEEEYAKAVALGIGKKVKAQEIWKKVYESQIESGVPYIAAKDSANRKTNHQNIGTIKQSNLCCLHGDTMLVVRDSDGAIHDKSIKEVVERISNMERWEVLSEGQEFQTILIGDIMREEAELLEIIDEDNGISIRCTPDHLIYTKNRGFVMAKDLVESDELEILSVNIPI